MSRITADLPLFSDLPPRPVFDGELRLMRHGANYVVGVDEVGRGPLAGPVVAAAVILDKRKIPQGLDDSKRLSPAERERLYQEILCCALAVGLSGLCAHSIDGSDIRKASLEAMRRAVMALAIKPCHALIDGRDIPPGLPCPADAWVKGDRRSVSIAAASIVAKVVRDRMMAKAGELYPAYGFEKHAGYATVVHRRAIEDHGPIKALHRYSFAPIKGHFKDGAT